MSKNTTKDRTTKQNAQRSSINSKPRTQQPESNADRASTKTAQATPTRKRIIKPIKNVNREYCPDKMKRSKPVKKVVMKPKCHLKVIGGLRRRKLDTPVKGVITTANSDPDWEAQDAILEAELAWDSEEDLMEILTCPSPVWWEDPPDEEYSEDPILIRRQLELNTESCSTNNTETVNLKMKINNTDKTFIEKRSKLENILGNIKNKMLDHNESTQDAIIFNEDLADDLENVKIPIANTSKTTVPKSMPPLKRRPVKPPQQDSISDRDVTFLDDSETSAVKNDSRQIEQKQTETNLEDYLDDSLVTIYKIMNEKNEKPNKINEFYKKMKNSKARRRKPKIVMKKCLYCNLEVKKIKLTNTCMMCKRYIVNSCKCYWMGVKFCKCKMTFAYKCKLCNFDTIFVEVMQKHLESHNCKKSMSKSWKRFCFAIQR